MNSEVPSSIPEMPTISDDKLAKLNKRITEQYKEVARYGTLFPARVAPSRK